MNPGRPLAISLCAALLLAAPTFAQRIEPGRTGVLTLDLHDAQDHKFVFRTSISLARYGDLASIPSRDLADLLETAHKAMAVHFGYTPEIYGPNYYTMLGPVRITAAWIDTGSEQVTLTGVGNDMLAGELSNGLPPGTAAFAQRTGPDRHPTLHAQPPIGQALKIKALRD